MGCVVNSLGLEDEYYRRLLPDNTPHKATLDYLFMLGLHIIQYSDDTLFVFPPGPQHLLYHPPAPVHYNSIITVDVVIVWAFLFLWQFRAP